MGNTVVGQTSFPLQSPAKNIYRVGVGCQFTTIQAAINQAFADGHTSNDNLAIVEVSPGTYTENLSLKPGVNVCGLGVWSTGPGSLNSDGTGGITTVIGNHDYTVSNGLNRTQNSITIANINLTCLNGVTLLVAGTSPCQLVFSGMALHKQAGGDSNPILRSTNSGAGTRIRSQNNGTLANDVANNAVLCDLQQNTTFEMRDRTSVFFSNVNAVAGIGVRLSNTATFRATNVDGLFNGSYSTACIEIASSTITIDLRWVLIVNTNTGAGASLISYNQPSGAANAVRLRWCFLQVGSATGYLGKNTSGNGGSWQQGSNVLITTAGGTSGNVQNGINIGTDLSNATNAA